MGKPTEVKLVKGEAPPDGYLPPLPAELARQVRVAKLAKRAERLRGRAEEIVRASRSFSGEILVRYIEGQLDAAVIEELRAHLRRAESEEEDEQTTIRTGNGRPGEQDEV